MKWHEMTWPELARVDRDRVIVIIPIAACEQHSRHLAVYTDSILCGGISDRVEAELKSEVLLLPLQWLGASDHHLPYGATLTLSVDTHITMLCELLTSVLDNGFRRLLLLNGHGGNIDTLHVALRRLQIQFPDRLLTGASYWEIAQNELARLATGERKVMGHACEFEASMMMHFRPDLVRASEIRDDHQELPDSLRGLYVAQDMGQRTVHGCVGYPQRATAELGKKFVDAVVERVCEVCRSLLTLEYVPGRQVKYR